jgi:hypothetical protein
VPQGQGVGILDPGGLGGGLALHAVKIFFFPTKVNWAVAVVFLKYYNVFSLSSRQGGELVQENALL